MTAKVGNVVSRPKPVTGGAVQGSILGVLDHNAVIEFVDEDFTIRTEKYVDDMTTVESIPNGANYYYDEAYETKLFHATETENSIQKLKKTCDDQNLKINASKTQLLAISAGREPV